MLRASSMVTREERRAGYCPYRCGTTLAFVPDAVEREPPFGSSIMDISLYLRFTQAFSHQPSCNLFEHLFGLSLGEVTLDALFRRARPTFDDATKTIMGMLRRWWIVGSDETSVRGDLLTFGSILTHRPTTIPFERELWSTATYRTVFDGFRSQWAADLFASVGYVVGLA